VLFLFARLVAILPGMIVQQSGHIVAISSVQGKVSIPFRSACKFQQFENSVCEKNKYKG